MFVLLPWILATPSSERSMALERPSSSSGELGDLESSGNDSVEPELDEAGGKDRRGSERPFPKEFRRGALHPDSLTLDNSILRVPLY